MLLSYLNTAHFFLRVGLRIFAGRVFKSLIFSSFSNGHRTPNGSPLKSNGHLNGLNNSHSPGKSPAKSPRQQRLTELEPYGITYDRLKMYKQRMRDIEQAPIDTSGEVKNTVIFITCFCFLGKVRFL